MSTWSPEWVDRFFTDSNWVAILGAFFVLIGAVGIFFFGRLKDQNTSESLAANRRQAAQAMERTAALTLSNTQLQIDLERERSSRLTLEKKVAPRHLSIEQVEMLRNKISATRWKKAEIIWHGTGDSQPYAEDLAKVFEQAGVKVNIHTLGPFIPSAWGLMVIRTTNSDAQTLKGLLDDAGVVSQFAITNETVGQKSHPTLLVGTREDLQIQR